MMNTASLFLTAAVSAVLGAQEPPANEPLATDPPAVEADAGASTTPEAAQDAPALLPDQDALRAEAEALRIASIARADAWFAQLDTLQARFLQYSPGGVESGGDLALDRPGRVRFDYDDPSPILMVADGATVALADFALETIDRVPLSATPLRYVLGDAPLNASDAVDQVNRADERIYITLIDPSGETDGRLTLIFHDAKPDDGPETMVLEGWYAVDAMGGLTEVRLLDAQLNERLDPRLFILDDEDVMGRDRRRGRR
jgi:outer membrane lipoprotein-sorting protein